MVFGDDAGTNIDSHGERASAASCEADATAESVARILCLRQLDVRARTRVELATYLHRKEVPTAAAERVLDRFAEIGLIDDQSLAESFVIARHQEHGLARRALALKLRQRGVQDTVVEAAVGLVDADSELAAAQRLVERRLRSVAGLDRPVQVRRLVSVLARKGYAPGLAYRVVREVMEASEVEVDPVWRAEAELSEIVQLDLD